MAKSVNQKLKILYLMKILLEKTDETHSITMPEILASLECYGISAERKSIYDDLESLRQYGLDIIGIKQDRSYHYHIGNRQFELAELKLLVDSVQASKFITAKKSHELIRKIEGMASQYEASQLQRQVYVAERVKTLNENIYYNVDMIHNAIHTNSQITFQYFQWNVKKEMELKHDGAYYIVSPWALSWEDESYYMVAYDSKESMIKHFRVDKMLHIDILNQPRDGKEHFREFDIAVYAKRIFGMYSGEEQIVKLECEKRLVGVMIDRFGTDISLHPLDEGHFTTTVKVALSRQFLAWVISLGKGVKIVGSEKAVRMMQEEVERLVGAYLE